MEDKDILDLLNGTLANMAPLRFTDLRQKYTDFEWLPRVMRRDKVQLDGGIRIERRIVLDHDGQARQTELYDTDQVTFGDSIVIVKLDWRHTETKWAIDRRESFLQGGGHAIVRRMQELETSSMHSLLEHMEEQGFGKPTDSSDTKTIAGLAYWLVRNATAGFNGGNPAGFSSGAGEIDATTTPKWKNYTFTYSRVSADDLIRKLEEMMLEVRWKTVVDVRDFRHGKGMRYRHYVNKRTWLDYSDYVRLQNDNIGMDAGKYMGELVFMRYPIVRVPFLDSDTTDPWMSIDYSQIYPVVQAGDYLRRTSVQFAPGQHNVMQRFTDMTWNVLCPDRRRQGIGYKVAA